MGQSTAPENDDRKALVMILLENFRCVFVVPSPVVFSNSEAASRFLCNQRSILTTPTRVSQAEEHIFHFYEPLSGTYQVESSYLLARCRLPKCPAATRSG